MKEEKFTGKFKVGDNVYLLNGSKIPNFAGGWIPYSLMEDYVGEMAEITGIDNISNGYCIKLKNGDHWTWDERAMSKELKKESIVIYSDERVVTALNKNTNEKCTVRCNTNDKYDFKTGAIIALSRLVLGFTVGDKVIGNEKNRYAITNKGWIGVVSEISIRTTPEFKCEMKVYKEDDCCDYWWVDCNCFDLYTESKDKEIHNKKFNMKVVCTKEGEGYTLGKIYEISDVKLIDDTGDTRPMGGRKFESFEDLNSGTAKFIKLVEE